ncbi:S8 family peptidase [Pseudosporangium ferrugineum]|uniref:Subtilase family protein n=1 Tax=Pseudosporangium ferrugineum TaxID=439699 RepID=A0A2T0SIT1_9ACTN|nr:S8/S53 family peptidase [Pseudosporangium ferrugineum]PRY33321.1 subtilase family protein [Pseudosporangium ferrugineum]
MTVTSQWPFPDTRSAAQLAHDRADVRRQVDVLLEAQPQVVERIRVRRGAAGSPILAFAPDDTDRRILVAENEIVVDPTPEQRPQLGALLAGYRGRERRERSRGQRTRVFSSDQPRDLESLRTDAKRLRRLGVTANVNMIVPLGYVIKGSSYPGVTVAPRPFATNGAVAPVRVAIIDTGLTDQVRTDNWIQQVQNRGTDPLDVVAPLQRIDWFGGHGTFATGIVRQIAPDCDVWVYRFTGPDGLGTDEAAADMMIQAADDAAGQRVIINASFGAPAVDGVPPLALQEAVDYVHNTYPKALIVASAGNDGQDLPHFPAAFPGVVSVGALNSDLSPAAFSNHGAWLDCSSVGVGVVSTYVQGVLPPDTGLGADITFGPDAWATWSGTSFAAPQISAAVAALCGADASLTPRNAFTQLIGPRPDQPGYGKVVHVLPGTPL